MSNENQTGTPTDVPSGTPATPKKAEKKQGGNLLSWINLVLILTLAVLAGFAAWLGLQYQQQTAKDMAVMENNLDSALEGLKTSSNREAELDARARQLADRGRIVFLVTHDLTPEIISQVDHMLVYFVKNVLMQMI